MPKCQLCGKEFPLFIMVDNKKRNLQRRKYCLECSPFGFHNTRPLTQTINNDDILKTRETRRKKRYLKKIIRYRRKRKMKLVDYKGGKCQICGYKKRIPRVFCFHHRNRKDKKFKLSSNAMNILSWAELTAEVDKCDLLCANCHAEVHEKTDNTYGQTFS